jgi:hypothetical protein
MIKETLVKDPVMPSPVKVPSLHTEPVKPIDPIGPVIINPALKDPIEPAVIQPTGIQPVKKCPLACVKWFNGQQMCVCLDGVQVSCTGFSIWPPKPAYCKECTCPDPHIILWIFSSLLSLDRSYCPCGKTKPCYHQENYVLVSSHARDPDIVLGFLPKQIFSVQERILQ